MGVCFGTTDLSVVAFAQQRGHPEMAGVLLGTFAIGSFIAGIVYGATTWHASAAVRFRSALVAIAITSVPLILAPTIPLMAVAALLIGLAISPALIAGTTLVELIVPAGALTEGFAWTTSAIGLGIALGSATTGGLIETYGPNKALILTTAAGVAATLVATAGTRLLRPSTKILAAS